MTTHESAPGRTLLGIPAPEYHASPGLSYSSLKAFATSPAYYWALKEAKRAEETKIETLIHLILESVEAFDAAVIVVGDKRTKAGKDAAMEAKERNLIAVSQADWDLCRLVRYSVSTDVDAGEFLREGNAEVSMYWGHHEIDGLLCRGRADRIIGNKIIDWKCVGATLSDLSQSPMGLPAMVERMKWHWQAAFYSDGLHQITGNPSEFINVFIDHRAVWRGRVPVITRVMGQPSQEMARLQYRPYLELFKRALDQGSFSDLSEINIPERSFL